MQLLEVACKVRTQKAWLDVLLENLKVVQKLKKVIITAKRKKAVENQSLVNFQNRRKIKD